MAAHTIITGGNGSASSARLGLANLAGLDGPAEEGESIESLLLRLPSRVLGAGVYALLMALA